MLGSRQITPPIEEPGSDFNKARLGAEEWACLENLFSDASQLPLHKQADFVARHCGHSAVLRVELLTLLAAQAAGEGPLDFLPVFADLQRDEPWLLPVGCAIGAWKVGPLIGRGGSGDVYAANRTDGLFSQAVVLKLLHRKSAPDLARFQAEREILASLDHPGITRIIDGGLSNDGRMYAVIEYIDGVSLLEHCRHRNADLHARLALFLQVCEVVAYAHRNLVVHRDLKPTNIMVTRDGRIKLLDFGVAKRIDRGSQVAAELTTAPFTPEYAAPEQLTGMPITTATDVYALGIVLFELLTDQQPWRSRGAPIARIVQHIVHIDVPPMSLVASSVDRSPVVSARLRGDLDAIVATCIRKDATDRYPTVDALRHDIDNYLNSEPVAARGRNHLYLLGRAARRYRWVALGTVVLVVSLAAGFTATAWQARKAAAERDVARRAVAGRTAVIDQLTDLFRKSSAHGETSTSSKNILDASSNNIFREYHDNPALLGKVVIALANTYNAVEDMEGEAALLDGYLAQSGADADRESVASSQQLLAFAELMRGHTTRAAELLSKADALWASDPSHYVEEHLQWLQMMGTLQREQGDVDESERTLQAAIKDRLAFSGRSNSETSDLYNALGVTLMRAQKLNEALTAYQTSVDIDTIVGRSEEPDGLVTLANTGIVAYKIGHLRDAERILTLAITKQHDRFGDSEAVSIAMGNYGATLAALGHYGAAVKELRPALAMAHKYAGEGNPMALTNSLFLVDALTLSGQLAEADELAHVTLRSARARFGEGGFLTLRTQLAIARIELANGSWARSSDGFDALIRPLEAIGSAAQPFLSQALLGSGEALMAQGKSTEAVLKLRRAVDAREQLNWGDQNWELALSRCRLGEAMLRAKQAGAMQLLTRSISTLADQLGPDHPQVLKARRILASQSAEHPSEFATAK